MSAFDPKRRFRRQILLGRTTLLAFRNYAQLLWHTTLCRVRARTVSNATCCIRRQTRTQPRPEPFHVARRHCGECRPYTPTDRARFPEIVEISEGPLHCDFADVRFRHKADVLVALSDVRVRVNS
jgi:hypothetical protein